MFSNSVRRVPTKTPINLVNRFQHKISKQKVEKELKVAPDVVKYLDSFPEYQVLKDTLPRTLLRKYKTPESMYLINKSTAINLAKTIRAHLNVSDPVIEVNPGLGLLSQEILKLHKGHIHMFEINNHFSKNLDALKLKYPDRMSYKIADFFGMWKLAFQDKIDQGNRITDLLGDLATNNNDRIVKILGSMPGLSFVKHLINSTVFHSGCSQLGRPDLFITMPVQRFDFLTDSEIVQGKHKSLPALFQLLFDFKVLNTVPTVHFLPWTHPTGTKKVTFTDEQRLYLVNITRKPKLPCPEEYLPLLWYFFKPHVFSKSTRVIPMLEQWIPGCGVWLITGQDPPDSKKDVAPGSDDSALPHMTIFTEFGDLTLKQKLTVFKKFVSWPEFEQCQFRTTMENNLPKTVAQPGDDKDPVATHIDDIDHSDSEADT